MNDYLDRAIRQTIEQAGRALSRIPSDLTDEFIPLAQKCVDELTRLIDGLNNLLSSPSMLESQNQSERHRKYQRAVRDMLFIESVGLTALERANKMDWQLNRLVKRIRQEINYPLPLPPAVTSISRDYFYIHTRFNFNLLCVPPGEGHSLLHLPDLYHELAHPLLLDKHLPRVRPFKEGLTRLQDIVLRHFMTEIQEEGRQRGPEEMGLYLELWMQCWYRYWAGEFLCDLFAVYMLGPAFAWAHLHLCAKRSSDPFIVPTTKRLTHPADDARMQMMLYALDRLGFVGEASAIENKWAEVVNLYEPKRGPEYRRCYPRELLAEIEDVAYRAVETTGSRIAGPNTSDFVHRSLNEAWIEFWRDQQSYAEWEKGKVEELYRHCSSGPSENYASIAQPNALLTPRAEKGGVSRIVGKTINNQLDVGEARSFFGDVLAKLLRELASNETVRGEHSILESKDILLLRIVPDEPPRGGLYDHLVFERKFYLSEKLLRAFSVYWEQNLTPLSEREQMCRLFFLHEFRHIPQHVDSNTYMYSDDAEGTFRYVDYEADAFAVKICCMLEDGGVHWTDRLSRVLAAHVRGGEVFSYMEDEQTEKSMDGGRLHRQVVWHLQYARASAFKPEATFEEFGIDRHLIIEVFQLLPGRMGENLCQKKSVIPSDLNSPLELHLIWGGDRRRYHLTTSHYADSLALGLFEADLGGTVEAFRPLFDEHPELTGRGR